MLGKQKLGGKLLVAFLIVGTIPFLLNGIMMMFKSKKALEAQSFSQLVSIREVKKERIERLFTDHQNNMAVLMNTVATLRQAAFQKLQTAQENKKAQLEFYFRERLSNMKVLSKSAHVIDALTQYQDAFKGEEGKVGGFMYDLLDKQFEGSFKQFVKEYSYYDLYLIWKNGDVVYSLDKESDIGANVATGTLKDSALGKCFQASLKKENIIDFEPYAPSNNQACAFIGAPVITKENDLIGCVVVQLLKDPINTVVERKNGMGETSKTYLAAKGEQGAVSRSDITAGDEKVTFGQPLSYPFIGRALAGESGKQVVTDKNGLLRIVAYDPVHIEGLDWAIISDIQMGEAIAPRLADKKYDYFNGYVQQYGYVDLLLIHPKGDVFYSVKHYSDYQTNLINGKFAKSGLGAVFKTVLQTKKFGFADFTAFPPYKNKPAAFIAQPVIQNNVVQLVVAVMLSPDEINAIMKEQTGMGSTGETYLIGADGLMRSDCGKAEAYTMAASFEHPDRKIDTPACKLALNGKTGRMATNNYMHEAVLSAYTPLDVWGTTKWALIAEIQEKEAFAPITNLFIIGVAIAGFALILVVAGTILISRSIVAPIKSVVNGLTDVAHGKGDLTMRLAETQKDEIGELSKVFNEFMVNLQAIIKSIANNAGLLQSSSSELSELSHHMSNSSKKLSDRSNLVNVAANEMNANMDSVAGAVSEVSSNTNMVASAAEEMTSTINEIAQSSEKAALITRQTVDQTKVVSGRVKELGDATQNIGDVTETITKISEQTNLLALNATIEAARAGDAGKGFAVVANEIKELAQQTAQATSDIKSRINGIQESMAGTVVDIGKIVDTIKQVDEIVSSIAGAVEEQSATTKEIAQNVVQVSEGINGVNTNASQSSEVAGHIADDIAEVDQAAMEISDNSAQVEVYVEKLIHLAEELNNLIRQFTV